MVNSYSYGRQEFRCLRAQHELHLKISLIQLEKVQMRECVYYIRHSQILTKATTQFYTLK